jgi:TM2 domain-containing membrane protein YozV
MVASSGDPFMPTPTGLNLGASAYVPTSKLTFAPQPVPRNPALAFLLSLLLPGLGQFYCRKNSRGAWTLVLFLIALGITIWLTPMLVGTYAVLAVFGWGVLLRVAAFLYVFAFLDAYFTAREMSAGTDPFVAESPRVAAILNLLTRGFGYFYLGQRAAGFAVFIGFGIFLQSILNNVAKGDRAPVGLFMEAVFAGLAIHAYGIARKREKEILATIEPAPQFAALGGLPPAVPLGLAVLFGAAYLGLCCIPFFVPDYSAINQTPARISSGDKDTVYTNPEYGVEFRAPAAWSLADQDTKQLVGARRNDNVCAADVSLAAWSPILPLGSYVRALSAHLERPENKGRRIVHTTPTRLGGLPALDVLETREEQGGQVTEHLIVARRGMTLYVLTTDSLTESTTNCELDFRFIQQHLGLPR